MKTIEITGVNGQKVTIFVSKITYVSDTLDDTGHSIIHLSSKSIRSQENYKDILELIKE